MRNDRLTSAHQENLLSCLAFHDGAALVIRDAVDADLFSSEIYREVASACIEYLDQYGETPKEHLPDLFADVLEGRDERRSELYSKVIDNLYFLRDTINIDFILSKLRDFVREQRLKKAITDAARDLQEGSTDLAETTLNDVLKSKDLASFTPGLVLHSDPSRFVYSTTAPVDVLSMGIDYFDRIEFGPTRKELLTLLAPPNRGKSWGLVHIGKYGLLQRKRVLHITLEMSEARCAQRYLQALFSLTKRHPEVTYTVLEDVDGALAGFGEVELSRKTLRDSGINQELMRRIKRLANRFKLVIKQFPTGQLTISGLHAYLDRLERQEGFIPDLILIDYADLMKVDSSRLRTDLGQIYKDIRGMGVERDTAMVTASQSNRSGEDAKILTLRHLGEDYSKAATSDMLLSYNQTMAERRMGLARLFVAKHRNDEVGSTIMVSQAYPMGQFVIDSKLMTSRYWTLLDKEGGEK